MRTLLRLVLSLHIAIVMTAWGSCVRGNAAAQSLSLLVPRGAQAVNPEITLLSGSEVYLSTQPGARNSANLLWSAAAAGSYSVRLSADCSSGTVLASGTYSSPDQPVTLNLSAGSFAPGATPLCIRVTSERGNYADKQAFVIRDDDAPTVTVTPGTGAYGTLPEIAVSCTDPGGSGCGQAALNTGSDPVMDLSGVLSGTPYTGPFSPPDSATTAYRFKIMDRAGNQSGVLAASYTVDTILPTITVSAVNPSTLAVSSGSISFSYKTNVKGTAALRLGSNCSGTVLATASIGSISPASLRGISIPAATVSSNLVVGPNDVSLCVTNTAGLVGFTTRTFTRDVAAPGVASLSAPSGTVDPDSITFVFNFDEPMRSSSAPLSFTAQGFNVAFPAIARWITSQSLEVKVFPLENMEFSWSMSGLPDLAGNLTASNPSGTFRTGMRSKRRLRVTETQQTLCFDDVGTTIPCAGTGQNGLDPSFPTTALLTGPFAPNPSYPTDAVVTDGNTGLMWMACPTTQTWNGLSCTGTISIDQWDTAYGYRVGAANAVNSNAGYAGFRDWRLPTAVELASIKAYGSNALPPAAFPGAASRFYWTGTGNGSSVYIMTFMNTFSGPDMRLSSPSGTSGVSFLVRDPNPAVLPASFTDNGDGTVWDPENQLTWEKCSEGQPSDCSGAPGLFKFMDAVQACEARGSGWRIPTIKELKSLTDYAAGSSPYVYPDFPGTSGVYWSSTAHQSHAPVTKQNAVDTLDGTVNGLNRDGTQSASVRCVKGP